MLNQIKELFVPFKSFNDGLIGDINFFVKLLITIDRFGNALTGGKGNHTISARVGYFNNRMIDNQLDSGIKYKYWASIESVINWSFDPIDGTVHCFKAYLNESENAYPSNDYKKGSYKLLALLGFIVLIASFFISAIIRTFVLIKPSEKHEQASEIKLWRLAVLWIICVLLYPSIFDWDFVIGIIKFAIGF